MTSATPTTPATAKAPTAAQRVASALERIQADLAEAASDGKRLHAALLEVAAELLASDAAFTARVLARYEQLAPPKRATTGGGSRGSGRAGGSASTGTQRKKREKAGAETDDTPLEPIRDVPAQHVTLAGQVDPYWLLERYGAHQLARALNRHTLRELQGACKLVEARNPGTKPQRKTNSQDIIAYIVEYVGAAEVAVPGKLQD